MGDKDIHTFPESINPKMNLTEWLGFQFAYFEAAILPFSLYATGTTSSKPRINSLGITSLNRLQSTEQISVWL